MHDWFIRSPFDVVQDGVERFPPFGDFCVTVIPAPEPESRGGGQVKKHRPFPTSYVLLGVMQRSPFAGMACWDPFGFPQGELLRSIYED